MSDPEASPGPGPSEGAHICARCSLRHPFLDRLQNNANPSFAQAFIFQVPGVLFPATSGSLSYESCSSLTLPDEPLSPPVPSRKTAESVHLHQPVLSRITTLSSAQPESRIPCFHHPHLRLLPSAAADTSPYIPHQLSTPPTYLVPTI